MLAKWYLRQQEEKAKKRKEVRQPVIDGAIGSDAQENAKAYLELFDRKARTAKSWYDRCQAVALVAPVLVTVCVGHAPNWVIQLLGGLATIATGVIAYKKFDLMWLSFRQAAHDLSFATLELSQEQIFLDEFKKRFMEILRAEATRFQIVAAQKREDKEKGSSGQQN